MTSTIAAEPRWIPAPSGPLPVSLGAQRLALEPAPQYPIALANVTNRCNLSCEYCFVFRDGNPNDPEGEMSADEVLAELERLRDRHGLQQMIWMGGEPMIRWRMLEKGIRLFQVNTIITNGTIPLKDFGPGITYGVSLDGPKDLNDRMRGEGVFDTVLETIAALPDDFQPTVIAQCVVHRDNQHRLAEFVETLRPTKFDGVLFSLLVPECGERSSRAWDTLEEREAAIDTIFELKRRHPRFVLNSGRSLDLMRAATAKLVTDNCPALKLVLPLYLDGKQFATPFCCYGNDVDCDRCGAWGIFAAAAKLPGPWDDVLPPRESSSVTAVPPAVAKAMAPAERG